VEREKKLIWWDPEAPGQTPDKVGKWVGLDVPDFNAFLAPTPRTATSVHHAADLVGAFFGPLNDGPSRSTTSRSSRDQEPALEAAEQSRAKIWSVPDKRNDLAPWGRRLPVRHHHVPADEHHLSGVMSRYLPMLAELFESHFAEISHELAKELGIANGDKVTVSTPRGKIVARPWSRTGSSRS